MALDDHHRNLVGERGVPYFANDIQYAAASHTLSLAIIPFGSSLASLFHARVRETPETMSVL